MYCSSSLLIMSEIPIGACKSPLIAFIFLSLVSLYVESKICFNFVAHRVEIYFLSTAKGKFVMFYAELTV